MQHVCHLLVLAFLYLAAGERQTLDKRSHKAPQNIQPGLIIFHSQQQTAFSIASS